VVGLGAALIVAQALLAHAGEPVRLALLVGDVVLPVLLLRTARLTTRDLLRAGLDPVLTWPEALCAYAFALVATTLYMGRVGPLTVALAVATQRRKLELRHPEEAVMVG